MAKNFYCVAKGNGYTPNIYKTWDETKPLVIGVPGSVYSGFEKLSDALVYLMTKLDLSKEELKAQLTKTKISVTDADFENAQALVLGTSTTPIIKEVKSEKTVKKVVNEEIQYPQDVYHVYVDGSYSETLGMYSFGLAVVKNDVIIHVNKGQGSDTEAATMRQIGGEILGSQMGVDYALSREQKEICILYDYEGVKQWALGRENGGWRSKNVYTKAYHEYMQKKMNGLKIHFVHIDSHTGNLYNELVDELAKSAVDVPLKGAVAKLLKTTTIKVANQQIKDEISKLVSENLIDKIMIC